MGEQTEDIRTCGRPTRAGTSCRVQLTAFADVCGMHATATPVNEPGRVYDMDGDQVVSVGKYAYRWRKRPRLRVGEKVLLPENWLSRKKDGPGHWEGVVTELGSTYSGRIAFVVDRVGQPARDHA